MPDDYAAVMIQIGGTDSPPDGAVQAATAVLMVRSTYPDAKITLWVHGYDDDPRELWEVPDVCAQVRRFVHLLTEVKPEWTLTDLNLDDASIGLLGMCCNTMHIVGRNPANGNYIFQTKPP